MKEKLLIWDNALVEGKYDIYQILEDNSGLMLLLVNEEDDSKIQLFWDVLVCAYKNTDESFWVESLEKLISKYGKSFIINNTFFVVENSMFSKEIARNGKGTIVVEELFHLKIISSNSIFDVVSWGQPEVTKIA